MIHLYHGDGKGKTTAACGLALRAAGSGMRVLFVQFFKNGGSAEVGVLEGLPGVTVMIPEAYHGRYKQMTEVQKSEIGAAYAAALDEIVQESGKYDMIVLDEAVSVYTYGLFDREKLLAFLRREGENREIVLTGRDPAPALCDLADYVTEMKKEKHPFDRGVKARRGIEY